MKKIILILFFSVFVLSGCNNVVVKNSIENNLNVKEINEKIIIIKQKLSDGEINKEMAQDLMQNIGNYSLDYIKKIKGPPKITGLPGWSKNIGLTEPLGMELDQDSSKVSSFDNKDEGYDSIILIYKGTYDQAIKEASIIAQKANIPLSEEFENAKKIKENGSKIFDDAGNDITSNINGVVYSNHKLTDINVEYLITISVNEDGTLMIDASNYKQMQNLIKN